MKRLLLITLSLSANLLIAQNLNDIENTTGLELGASAPAFTTIDQNDSIHSLASFLQKGSVVLVFYRGQWCPHCNKHMSNLQDSLKYITEKGANVIAVSPQKTDLINETIKKSEATFTLLYDDGYKIGSDYKVMFKPKKKEVLKYNMIGAKLEKSHFEEELLLPVPATYIISKEGVVIWRHFDHNYHNRSSIKDIINHIK